MTVVDFEQLQSLLQSSSTVLVDVRNPNELQEDGQITGSYNIALPEVSAAFQLEAGEFRSKYGFDMPSKESENLIISCR